MPSQDAIVWRPDTCDCEVLIDSKGNILDEEQVRQEQKARIAAKDSSANKVVLRPLRDICTVHKNMGHMVKNRALLNVLVDETQRKSSAYVEILSELSGIATSQLGERIKQDMDSYLQNFFGMTLEQAKLIADRSLINIAREIATSGLGLGEITEYDWSYNSARVLVINLPARIKQAQISNIQARADGRFGSNKVKVNRV